MLEDPVKLESKCKMAEKGIDRLLGATSGLETLVCRLNGQLAERANKPVDKPECLFSKLWEDLPVVLGEIEGRIRKVTAEIEAMIF